MTSSIKFFWNGIKLNGSKSLIKVFYSLDNNKNHSPAVTIYAREYGDQLPGDLFTVRNDTDLYTDHFDTDRATLTPEHPLYKYARYAAEKAEIRSLTRKIEQDAANVKNAWSDSMRDFHRKEEERDRARLAEFQGHKDPGQPTAADMAAVAALNTAAETARLAAEEKARQEERERVLNQQNSGRRFIEQTAADHPLQSGAPTVTITWSECPAFYSFSDQGGVQLSPAAAEIVLKHYNEEASAAHECYKTDFCVEYPDADDGLNTYNGRYDLGSEEGGLIDHIRDYGRYYQERGHLGNGQPTEEDKREGAEITALADLLEQYTDGGRVVSVTLAPWLTEALEARKKAEQQDMADILEAVEMLTDEQLEDAVMMIPNDDPEKLDVARFFLQKLAARDEKRALDVLRRWKWGQTT